MSRTILVVEDDRDIARLLEMHLKDAGYAVIVAGDGIAGFRAASGRRFDLILLDLILPGMDGLELCRKLRERPDYTPILMLTARSGDIDRILGIETGADDYLAKPFNIRELLARVKAIFRRVEAFRSDEGIPGSGVIRAGEMAIDTEGRRVEIRGQKVSLTAKEFDLLSEFARHPGKVYTRARLLDAVWGLGYDGYEHTVNSHINRLREKIEKDPARPRFVLTVRGVGYKFADREDLKKG